MNYRYDKKGNPISILGYGCMRFSRSGGRIDLKKTEREVLAAVEAGVNYFDTAYIYPGSEAALGEILERCGLRDRVYVTTKLPHYLIKSKDGLERIFEEQLRRLRTDYVDYYLMHMLTDVKTWERLLDLGIGEWLKEKLASGAIRQVGFSYHGGCEPFKALIDAFEWDICMIQYNYLDENSQAGRRGLLYAHDKGIPVVVMEPLRGGRLANNLPAEAVKLFDACKTRRTPAQWALRWLWNQPEVTCAISGMNSLEMLGENIDAACEAKENEFTSEDKLLLRNVAAAINSGIRVGCTGCGYCLPCPKNVDIPGCFAAYNRRGSDGRFISLKEYFMCTAMRRNSSAASNCIGCGKCMAHCPQGIDIPSELKKVRSELEGPLYRLAQGAVRLFKAY